MGSELVVVDAKPVAALSTLDTAPAIVLAEAGKAAAALKDVISSKPKPVEINGETYLEFEDWQTVGRFYGVTAGIESAPTFIEVGGVHGFTATAVALRQGQVISRATAFCMRDEDRWSKAPTYQVASMAQTRACAKVLRNCLGWVAVLGGYKPTPKEEMDGVRSTAAPASPSAAPKCPKCGSAAKVIASKYPDKATGLTPWYCLSDKTKWGNAAAKATAAPDDEPWSPDEDEAGARG